jgi:hypothetical protein
VARRRRAPAHGLHPGQQLGQPDRFDQVVVRAEAQAAHDGTLVAVRGQHQHRQVGDLAELAQHLQAVDVGQAQVEQHQVGVVVAGQGVRAALDPGRPVAGRGQRLDQGLADAVVVLDQ